MAQAGTVRTIGGLGLRGQPIIALVAVLGGWIGGRAATWTPPTIVSEAVASPESGAATAGGGYVLQPGFGPQSMPGGLMAGADASPVPGYADGGHALPIQGAPVRGIPVHVSPGYLPPGYVLVASSVAGAGQAIWQATGQATSQAGGTYGGVGPVYQLPRGRDWRADFANLAPVSPQFEQPSGFSGETARPVTGAPMPAGAIPATLAAPTRPRRWSADAWTLLRRDGAGGAPSPGVQPATYGASQAGAVLRYRLAMANPHQPQAYLRTTSSMGQVRESTAALGLSARPFATVPVVAAIEGRLTDRAGIQRIQPAAMAITELPPFALPGGMRGETYLQAGYIAGAYATAFVDGQFRLDRGLWRLGGFDLRAGGGAWGGVQKGGARFDVGPSASLVVPMPRGTYGRVALDWRFRVAGTALPGSGPAVTLSASF